MPPPLGQDSCRVYRILEMKQGAVRAACELFSVDPDGKRQRFTWAPVISTRSERTLSGLEAWAYCLGVTSSSSLEPPSTIFSLRDEHRFEIRLLLRKLFIANAALASRIFSSGLLIKQSVSYSVAGLLLVDFTGNGVSHTQGKVESYISPIKLLMATLVFPNPFARA